MKHIIMATDKKTGFKRHFEFEGNIFVDGLIVEEILTEPLESQEITEEDLDKSIELLVQDKPSPKIEETHKEHVKDFYLAAKVDELIRAFNSLQEK